MRALMLEEMEFVSGGRDGGGNGGVAGGSGCNGTGKGSGSGCGGSSGGGNSSQSKNGTTSAPGKTDREDMHGSGSSYSFCGDVGLTFGKKDWGLGISGNFGGCYNSGNNH